MKYRLALVHADGSKGSVVYDATQHRFFNETGEELNPSAQLKRTRYTSVRIALGHKCNFHCKYCLQEPFKNNYNELDWFTESKAFELIKAIKDMAKYPIENFQYWGGEGLLYIDQIKLVHKAVQQIIPEAGHHIVTNGSLLKGDTYKFLKDNGFTITISHDAMGQKYRTLDFLEDEEILHNINTYHDNGNKPIDIACVMSNANASLEAVTNFFKEKLTYDFKIGDIPVVDIKTDAALACAMSEEQLIKYAKETTLYAYKSETSNVLYAHANSNIFRLGQPTAKNRSACFVGNDGTLVVDLKGNILTCQSVCYDEKIHGEDACLGNVFTKEYREPNLQHLAEYKEQHCTDCILLNICGGGCPFASEKYAEYNCKSRFYSYIPVLAVMTYMLTGAMLESFEPIKE